MWGLTPHISTYQWYINDKFNTSENSTIFEKLWYDFIQEEKMQEAVAVRVEEIQNLALIKKETIGGKKGPRRGQKHNIEE